MKWTKLKEEKLQPKLPVFYSTKIRNQISIVDIYNRDKPNEVLQWHEYIDWVANYISNPTIAFDYMHRYTHFRNGAVHINELGVSVGFIVKYNSRGAYVYIFGFDLALEDFGLKMPSADSYNDVVSQANMPQKAKNDTSTSMHESFTIGDKFSMDKLRMIAESVANQYKRGADGWRKEKLFEKYYNPFREPMIDGNLNGYDVLNGSKDEQIICDLPEKGWVEDLRMYSKMRSGGKTYCLYRRTDNGKYFFVEIYDDPRDEKHLHGKAIPKKDVPDFIMDDAVSLIRRNRKVQDLLRRLQNDARF